MKKNDWLEKLSLADKKYVDEANPALPYTEKSAPKRRIKWGRVTAMAACFLAVLCTVALFVPYSYSPPSVKRYADSEYYSVIEKLNVFNYEKNRPKEKNLFQSIGKALSSLNKDTGGLLGGVDADYAPNNSGNAGLAETKYHEITDNQVEGVTEGDIIKRSDKYVYHISYTTLYVYPITGKAEEYIGSYNLGIPAEDGTEMYMGDSETEMYLSNDCKTVTVITQFYGKSKKDNEYLEHNTVMVRSLDVSNPENITEKNVFTVEGAYNTSRMVDGKLLLITTYRPQNVDFSDESTFVPTASHDDVKEKLPADCIFAPEKLDDGCYTVVTLLNEDGLDTDGMAAFLSYTGCIYVNKEDVFLTRRFNEKKVTKTEITRISYRDTIESKGSVTVDGYLNNQYSLDVYDGYLRAVTTLEGRDYNSLLETERTDIDISETNASLYCIDLSDLSIAAEVKRFAPDGERVRSVRFDGNNAYVCTSIQTYDPVFFFDLSDINNITVKDTGTIDGLSTSLVNFNDGFLIGIGRGASGDLKIDVYEETADGVRLVSSYEREHVSYSTDYKAYYIDREKGLIGLAVRKYRGGSAIPTEYVLLHFDGYELREHVRCTIEGDLNTIRGVYIDDILYAFGNGCMRFVSRLPIY